MSFTLWLGDLERYLKPLPASTRRSAKRLEMEAFEARFVLDHAMPSAVQAPATATLVEIKLAMAAASATGPSPPSRTATTSWPAPIGWHKRAQ
jgi:hypothetical protein